MNSTLQRRFARSLLLTALLVVTIGPQTVSVADDVVVIHLDPSRPTKFPLQLRIPRWCQKATVAVNGQPWQEPIAPGEFLSIDSALRPRTESFVRIGNS